jgi:hypothetical protein
VLANRP